MPGWVQRNVSSHLPFDHYTVYHTNVSCAKKYPARIEIFCTKKSSFASDKEKLSSYSFDEEKLSSEDAAAAAELRQFLPGTDADNLPGALRRLANFRESECHSSSLHPKCPPQSASHCQGQRCSPALCVHGGHGGRQLVTRV